MSNKTKHTPGPWTLGKGKVRVRTTDGVLIAECYTTQNAIRYADESQREANAILIESAPDMLEALKEARDLIEHWGSYASSYFQEKYNLAGDLAMLDSIIAKAENDNTFAVSKD